MNKTKQYKKIKHTSKYYACLCGPDVPKPGTIKRGHVHFRKEDDSIPILNFLFYPKRKESMFISEWDH